MHANHERTFCYDDPLSSEDKRIQTRVLDVGYCTDYMYSAP